MVIEPITIDDKHNRQLVMLPAECSILAAKGGADIITLYVKSNHSEDLTEHMFQVVKDREQVSCVPGEYIDSVPMADGSMRHVFGAVAPTVRSGDFCYINR